MRDGLHVFGASPEGRQRARSAGGHRANAARAWRARCLADPRAGRRSRAWLRSAGGRSRRSLDRSTAGHAGGRECLGELTAIPWSGWRRLAAAVGGPASGRAHRSGPARAPSSTRSSDRLRPAVSPLRRERDARTCRGLCDGRFVAPGPSGAPTRGRPDVLPTGRNFYSIDTRTVPTPAAWTLGQEIRRACWCNAT